MSVCVCTCTRDALTNTLICAGYGPKVNIVAGKDIWHNPPPPYYGHKERVKKGFGGELDSGGGGRGGGGAIQSGGGGRGARPQKQGA